MMDDRSASNPTCGRRGVLRLSAAGAWSLAVPAALSGCASPRPSAMADWQPFTLPGKAATRYDPGWLDGRPVVHARAHAAASMWRKRLHVAPGDLRGLRFSWRVDRLVTGADLRDAQRSDAPVKVMLAFEGDRARLSPRTRLMFELAQTLTGEEPPYATLAYVWSEQVPLETVVPSGRSDRVRKIVVDSGSAHLGTWRHHERDIRADFERAFGEAPGPLVGLALMTDSDNTGALAEAWYGEVLLG